MGMKHVIVLILSSLTTRELGIFSYAYWLPNILFRSLSVSLAIFIELFVYYVCSFLFFLFFFFILDTNIWSIIDIFEKSLPK